MENIDVLVKEIRSEITQTKLKIDFSNDSLPVELGLSRLLIDIEKEFNKSVPDKENLDKNAFGIFRLVTDSYSFEESPLGQDFLNIHKKIRLFIQRFY